MRYCTRCVLPESHESIQFDSEGVCNICRQAEVKHHEIDWSARREVLDTICDYYKGKGRYDCIVPFSGGQRQYVPIVVCCDPAKTEAFGCTLQSLGVSPIGTGEQCTDAEKACCRCY